MRCATFLVVLALAGGVARAAAQQPTGRITGVVLQQSGEPVPGANLLLVGTRVGTIAGEDGRYGIPNVPAGRYRLQAAMMGYTTDERDVVVPPNGSVRVDFSLEVKAVALGEVVVVGYGTQRRGEVTGAVASVTTTALLNTPVESFDQMLQGTAAGVVVTQASSAPGGGISVRVRGTSSINGSTEPLYVIDGFPIENDIMSMTPGSGGREGGIAPPNPLASLNPSDIESMQVLKDASATAIYGSRGANGVVIITTKQGRAGGTGSNVRSRPQLTIDLSGGTQSVVKRYELLNSTQLAQAINEFRTNQGNPAIFADPASLGVGTDWQDKIFRNAGLQSFQATIAGASAGENFTRYSISGGYFNQDGVVIGSGFKRLSARANVEQNLENRVRLGLNMTASRVETQFVPTDGESNKRAGAVGAALQAYPFLPVQFADGSYPYQVRDLTTLFGVTPLTSGIAAELPNPVSMATQMQDQLGDTRVLGNAYGEVEIVSGLRARVSLGGDYSATGRNTYFPLTTRQGAENGGQAFEAKVEAATFLNENTVTYDRQLGSAHRLNLLAGFTEQHQELTRLNAQCNQYATDITGYNDIGACTATPQIGSGRETWTLNSYLGRVNYSLLDRYLFTLTGRYDGSSRFGKGNKWGAFPSGAIAWRLSGEPFMRGITALDELKLRASYGKAGNTAIRPYQSLARLGNQGYSFSGVQVPGYFPYGVANSDLTWETTTQLDVGFDLGLWRRVTVATDFYHKDTDDLLLQVDLPSESGFSTALMNAGSVRNVGLEVSLNVDLFKGGRFNWNTGFSYASNANRVTGLGGLKELFATTISDDYKLNGALIRVGQPIGVFYGFKTAGVVKDAADSAATTVVPYSGGTRYRPGDLKLVDVNGDGRITIADRTVLGSPYPHFSLGWQNSASYGALSVSGLLQGVFGQKVLNLNMYRLAAGNPQTNLSLKRFENRWTPDHTNATYPRMGATVSGDATTNYTDLLIENGSFLRLSSVTVGLQLPAKWLAGRGLSGAQVYATGANLLTITDYSGFNPDVSSFGTGNVNRGIDVGAYPLARTIVFGAKLTY